MTIFGGPQIDVEVFGEPVVRRRLLRMGDRAFNAAPALRRVLGLLRESARLQFSTEGAHGGARWAELKPATLAQKARRNLDPKVLHATHRLRDSLLAERATADHVQHVRRDELRWGSRVPYGVFHMSRGERRTGADGQPVLPRRPPVALTTLEKRKITREVQREIVGRA